MKFYVESYGCTMNQSETEMIAESLEEEGHTEVSSVEEADEVLIGTCVVIKKTEERMKRRIEDLEEKCEEVIVAGCLSTTRKREMKNRCQNLDFFTPDDVKFTKNQSSSKKDSPIDSIPIASGCYGQCSYCITKLARGELNSRTVEKIKERFKKLVSTSTKEIRLTCQDTAIYGRDINTDLVELLSELIQVKVNYRIRIGMMNVDTLEPIKDDLLDIMGDEKIYKFLHLPLQSGSDKILEKMNRNYSAQQWKDTAGKFRKRFPDLTLSTDVIVGFPGENEQDFKETKKAVKDIKPDIINVTRFSPRKGTDAFEMEDKVHSREKKKRSKEMTDLRFEISREINESYVDRKTEVLILEEGKGNSLKGRMDNYKVVVLKDENKDLIGKWKKVKIKKAEDVYLLGEIV